MRLSLGQQMQMAQKQVLAPRMIQSMEILQLPIMALQERIEQEMEDNPVLDQIEPSEDAESFKEEIDSPDAPSESERELVVQDDTNNEEDFERLMNMADNLPDDYEERSRPSRGQMEAEADRRHDAMANMVSRPESLLDYLQHQLSWYDLSDDLRRLCERIIYNLDSNGYLETPLQDLIPQPPPDLNGNADAWHAEQLKLAQEALSIVQRLDPPGVGARNLKECLLLQLTPGLLFYEELQVLIENHLEDLENNRLPLISKKTGFSLETIKEAWEDLRTLKPKPGSEFNENFAPSVTPDVFIDRRKGVGTKYVWKMVSYLRSTSATTTASCCKIPRPTPRRATTSNERSIPHSGLSKRLNSVGARSPRSRRQSLIIKRSFWITVPSTSNHSRCSRSPIR